MKRYSSSTKIFFFDKERTLPISFRAGQENNSGSVFISPASVGHLNTPSYILFLSVYNLHIYHISIYMYIQYKNIYIYICIYIPFMYLGVA